MRARILALLEDIRSSYWFIPTLMAVGAVVLAFGLPLLDAHLGSEWMEEVSWLYANKPEGARVLLSEIAGSMITVAGVVFSITIAAVAYASSNFGPRLLTNFMRDRGNQFTLGTFIATFLYGLLVLRTIHSSEEDGGDVVREAFVPHISVLVGVGLAMLSIAVLIYFIHHVPLSIHASHVIAQIGRELGHKIESVFPEDLGQPTPLDEARLEVIRRESVAVGAPDTGYVEVVDPDTLLDTATSHDLVIHLPIDPGSFVTKGQAILFAWPAGRVTDEAQRTLRRSISVGPRRTPTQDALFLADELVEVAARALSSGVNDPFTAMSCMNWLTSAAIAVAEREAPATHRYDGDGNLRVVATTMDFKRFAAHAFEALRPYAAPDRNAGLHLMRCYARIAHTLKHDAHRQTLQHHAHTLHSAALDALKSFEDRQEMEQTLRTVQALIEDPSTARQIEVLMHLKGSPHASE